jgi:ubiquinone biosynthesis protein
MELLRGVPFSSLLERMRAGSADEVEELGIDRTLLAERLLYAMLEQMFVHQLYHGDTHPGNLIALPGSRVGFVDFGLVDRLDDTFRREMMRYLSAIAEGDTEAMYRALASLLITGDQTDEEGFREEFFAATRSWLRDRDNPATVESSPVGRYMVAIMRAARTHGLRFPPAILSMYRSIFTAEIVANQLDVSASLRTVGGDFFEQLQLDSLARGPSREQLQRTAIDVVSLLGESPGRLNQLLADLADDRFVLRVRAAQSADDRRDANRRAKLVAATILQLTFAVVFGVAGTLPSLATRWVRGGSTALLVLSLIWLVYLWRRLR